jgi:hypothetical protein
MRESDRTSKSEAQGRHDPLIVPGAGGIGKDLPGDGVGREAGRRTDRAVATQAVVVPRRPK